jgi:hypothetical protein
MKLTAVKLIQKLSAFYSKWRYEKTVGNVNLDPD